MPIHSGRVYRQILILVLLMQGWMSLSQNSNEIKEGYIDTIRFTGICQYVGKTGSIIATAYYRFKLREIQEGQLEGDTIVFEADVNSINERFLSAITMGEITPEPADSLFPDHTFPIQKSFRCQSEPMEVVVARHAEDRWWIGKIVTTYVKVWNPPPLRK